MPVAELSTHSHQQDTAGSSWAGGQAVGQEAAPGGPFLCGDHNRKRRALVSRGGSASQPGPTSLRAGMLGSFWLRAQRGVWCRAVGRARFGGLTGSAGEPEMEAHGGQRARGQHCGPGGCCLMIRAAGGAQVRQEGHIKARGLRQGLWTRTAGDRENPCYF